MTNIATGQNCWDWFTPQPQQDSNLLQQFWFIPGLKEILMLRQVHALEHATVWVLSEATSQNKFRPCQGQSANTSPERHPPDQSNVNNQIIDTSTDDENLGGLSTENGFYLYGKIESSKLYWAVNIALNRLRSGEWDLAVHPRCGTNSSVAFLLTSMMMMTGSLIADRGWLEQMIAMAIAAGTANSLAPELGALVQKYCTTAPPFNLKVKQIHQTTDRTGKPAYFVQVAWQSLQ